LGYKQARKARKCDSLETSARAIGNALRAGTQRSVQRNLREVRLFDQVALID